MTELRAVVFDFDGLILDTETAEFESWRDVYSDLGAELDRASWVKIIGTADSGWDPYAELERQLGHPLDRAAVRRQRRGKYARLVATETTRPGIDAWLREARAMNLRVGLASSSDRTWVTSHLRDLGPTFGRGGNVRRFDAMATGDEVLRTKPDPAVYELALRRLDVDPDQAIAVEDSPNGVAAAKAAGLWCLAVPGPMTAGLDFGQADLVLDSLAGHSLREVARSLVRDPGAAWSA